MMPLGNFRLGSPPTNPQNQNSLGQPNWVNTGQMFLRGLQQAMPYLSKAGVPMPPGINFLMKGLGGGFSGGFTNPPGIGGQGFRQQGIPQQGIPQQGFPQQGIPQQGYPSQGFFSQGFPPQAYPQQRGNLNNTLNVQSPPPLPSPQSLFQQAPQVPVKGGGIKGLISRFMARRKG